LSHLFHQSLDHVNVGDLRIVEVILDFIKVLLRQALVWLVDWSLFLIFYRVVEHAFFVPIHTEPVKIFYAGHILF
jgi:hypothetical protein